MNVRSPVPPALSVLVTEPDTIRVTVIKPAVSPGTGLTPEMVSVPLLTESVDQLTLVHPLTTRSVETPTVQDTPLLPLASPPETVPPNAATAASQSLRPAVVAG